MANYYTLGAVTLAVDKEQASWLESVIVSLGLVDDIRDIVPEVSKEVVCSKPSEATAPALASLKAWAVHARLHANASPEVVTLAWDLVDDDDMGAYGWDYLDNVEREGSITIYHSESFDAEFMSTLLMAYLNHFELDEAIGFEWSNTTSKNIPWDHGGGACTVTRHDSVWMSTDHFAFHVGVQELQGQSWVDWPTEPGFYWFYGWTHVSFARKIGGKPELMVVGARKIAQDKILVHGNGEIFYDGHAHGKFLPLDPPLQPELELPDA
jgi:hypothetical protein